MNMGFVELLRDGCRWGCFVAVEGSCCGQKEVLDGLRGW